MPQLSSDDVARPVLLTSLLLDGWELSEPKALKAMKIANLTRGGRTPITRLADGIKLTIPFAPTAFGGGAQRGARFLRGLMSSYGRKSMSSYAVGPRVLRGGFYAILCKGVYVVSTILAPY